MKRHFLAVLLWLLIFFFFFFYRTTCAINVCLDTTVYMHALDETLQHSPCSVHALIVTVEGALNSRQPPFCSLTHTCDRCPAITNTRETDKLL